VTGIKRDLNDPIVKGATIFDQPAAGTLTFGPSPSLFAGGSGAPPSPTGGSTLGFGFDDQATADEFNSLLQDFLNIFRPYIADQDLDDIDRINRQEQASEFLDVLAKYVKGNATLEDLKAVDVRDLEEMDGWNEYYESVTTDETAADTEDTGTGTGEETDTRQKTDEWNELKEAYENGEATLRDLQNFDPGALSDNETWMGQYNDFVTKESQAPQTWEEIEEILRRNGYSESEIASVEGGLRKTKEYSDWLEYPENRGKEFGGQKYCHEREQRGGNTPYDDDCQTRGSVNIGFILGELGYENGSWWDVRPTAGTACTTDAGTVGTRNSAGDCIEDPKKAPGAACANGPHGSQGVLDKDGNCTFVVGNSCRLPGETNIDASGVIDSKGDCVPSGQGTSGGDCSVITQENADECGFEIDENGNLIDKDRDPDSVDDDSVAPFYTNCGGGIFAKTEADCPDVAV